MIWHMYFIVASFHLWQLAEPKPRGKGRTPGSSWQGDRWPAANAQFRALRLVHGHACSSGFLQLRKKRPLLAPDTGKFKGGAGFRLGGAGLHSLQQCFQDLLAHSPAPDSASLAVASSSGGPDWQPTALAAQGGEVPQGSEILGWVLRAEFFLTVFSEIRGRNIKCAVIGSGHAGRSLRRGWGELASSTYPLGWVPQGVEGPEVTRDALTRKEGGWSSQCPLVVLGTQHLLPNDFTELLKGPLKIPSTAEGRK